MADKKNTDSVFKNIAKQYTELYGNTLLEEKAAMERQKIVYVMPRTDAAIKPMIEKRKRKAVIKIAAAIAAAVILAVSIPAILNRTDVTDHVPNNGGVAEEGVVMPLTFSPSYGYTVADSKLDNGQSIYYLDHEYGDDVVLTMEGTAAEAKYDYGEMDRVYIDGQYIYGLSTPDYQMLIFVHDYVLYTLSCKYDLGNIVALYRQIVY